MRRAGVIVRVRVQVVIQSIVMIPLKIEEVETVSMFVLIVMG